jgi:hypothetical protein
VLVHAEDLVHHQHDRELAFGLERQRTVTGNVSAAGRDFDFAGFEAVTVRGQRRRGDGCYRERKAGTQALHEYLAA